MSIQEPEHEAADVVAAAWRRVLAMGEDLIDPETVRAMYAQPRLRVLFPLVSHGIVQFSRCTRFPWTADVPVLYKRVEGGFVVRRLREPNGSARQIVGHVDTMEEGIALIVANLPEGCGPAIDGTADDL